MDVAELPRVTGRHRNKALAQERRTKAVELAVAGTSYQSIADQMGYANRGTVYRIVQEALKAHQITSIDEVRELEAARLDALQGAVWADAVGGSLQAVQTVLKIMEQRAKILGLHQPERTDVVTPAGGVQQSSYDFTTASIVPQ